ncbi:hypothetical protein COLO4_20866 [Corchorus olitorius]|uniref:Uncharacterized protein n=1 Tax=Corchorus olitorius TaxID=93759 RepID=A0A1R3IWE2_9ROSI|nr:hypothetical protein COLO4_20866 [Corchorus olitorius]
MEFRKRPYRFEIMWTSDPQCEQIISKAWNEQVQGSAAYNLTRRIQNTKERLKEWNKSHFGNLFYRKKQLEEELA